MMRIELKVALLKQGVKQNRLAAALRWDPAKLSRILNGIYAPTAGDRRALAKRLKVSVNEIFPQAS